MIYQLMVVIERQSRPEFLPGLIGTLLAGGANSGQLELGACHHRWQMCSWRPSPVDIGSYDTQTYFVGHLCPLKPANFSPSYH
jgi:hypothetical protein